MTAAIASESISNLNTLNLNLQSLSGITFDQIVAVAESLDGSVVAADPVVPVESTEPQEPPKKRGRKKSSSSSDMVVTSETVKTETSSFLNADQSQDPEEQKPIEPQSPLPRSGAALLEIQTRFELFGFRIPMPALAAWMPQTVRELEKTLFMWESIMKEAVQGNPVSSREREGYESAPALIRDFDNPSDNRIDIAYSNGCDVAQFSTLTDERIIQCNPYAPDTQLGQAWIEGFKSGKKTREASSTNAPPASPIAQPSSRSTLAAYEAGRSSARQEAIDRILSELFAENSTIKSLAEEIKDLKTNLKELNETREEHVVKSNRLMDELEKVSKGEFQEGLPFRE